MFPENVTSIQFFILEVLAGAEEKVIVYLRMALEAKVVVY